MSGIVGRERELALIADALDAVGGGTRAIWLHGEAGIGKTTLWQSAVELARARGFRVLVSRPTQAEARLAFAGLGDLLGDAFDEFGADLPDPQRLALSAALLRSTAPDASLEPLAVSLGALGLLRAAASHGPLALAVDDTPWLDPSSAATLDFVARRLDAEPVAIIAAERTAPGGEPTGRVVSAMALERVTAIGVAALTMAETERLLVNHGFELAPTQVKRLHATAAGNPFYAVEIGRAIERQERGTGDALVIPETLSDLLRERLDALSPAASDVVEHAAALSQPRVGQLVALLGAEVVAAGVEEATEEHILHVDADAVRFAHPLLAAELYAGLGDAQRRDLHRRLADVVTDAEEHAHHAALAADGPDEAVAAQLEQAAERAGDRGAPDAAAELVERALALTPDAGDRVRRMGLLAHHALRAGDAVRAGSVLEEALGAASPGDARAAVLRQLGQVRILSGDWDAGDRLFAEALTEVRDDDRLGIEIRLQLAGVSNITGRNWEAGAAHAFEAMRQADALGDDAVLARTLGPFLTWTDLTGADLPADAVPRVASLEAASARLRTMDRAAFDLANIRGGAGDLDGMRRGYLTLIDEAERVGDYSSLPFLLASVTQADFVAGEVELAMERLDRAGRLARTTGLRTALAAVLVGRTRLHARLGDADAAWSAGRQALDIVAETGWIHGEPSVRRDLALLELSRRDPESALGALGGFGAAPGTPGVPWILWHSYVRAEALIALGRLDEARAQLDGWLRHAPFRSSPARMRHVTRTTALLAAAEGDMAEADRLLAAAEAVFAGTHDRWAIARTALAAAEIHRRARRRGRAREALIGARDAFEALGARLWAAYAGEQLARVAGTRERADGLTPTQLQVAELAASGLTNQEVGDRLFMSRHTVEAHLTTVYRELGIRSRVELGAALATVGDAADAVRDSSPDLGAET